ncbi:MAG: efflux RND transporter permease subunit, partial [bacterium]
MSRFFINRPIVAMVISILMLLCGVVAMLSLPIAQFPNIAPPEILLTATYVGADALTAEQSVATPIEQQMSGVDNMLYMYSINTSQGQTSLRVDFDVATDANTDQILTQMRYLQAASQLPMSVQNYGVTVRKSTTSPLALFSLVSPKGSFDATYLANYAYININDPLTRVPGVGQVQIFGAGQYAMRLWVRPDTLAKLGVTVQEIVNALNQQNTVNPAGAVGAEPVPSGQAFTLSVRAQGRLTSTEEFGNIVVRANHDGSFVRIRDVARLELGAQMYNVIGRLNGNPAAIIAIYQLPGANALKTMQVAKQMMEDVKKSFPKDVDYVVSLDTTLAVTSGINEIVVTLLEAMGLVMLVVFLFLQNWRATLIPLLAVPVSLVGAFVLFPVLGFSINTLSLFGLVLAIGLVVDDAIIVVEAVEHHIEHGLAPKAAALKAMSEVSGPVVSIALILAAVFVPTAFIPGITGRLYQQFALTIALSVLISAFNALTLSPALAALLLRPRKEGRGPLAIFFRGFNRMFGRATDGYVSICGLGMRKTGITLLLLGVVCALTIGVSTRLPSGFLPDEDQGFFYLNVQLPPAASLQRTDAVCRQVEALLAKTAGVQSYNTVAGFSMLSQANTTYNAFYFVSLKPWAERDKQGLVADKIMRQLNGQLRGLPGAQAFAFAPPAISGVGTSGGVTFMLEDRAGQGVDFLGEQTKRFLAAANQRPEFASVMTTFIPSTPQLFAQVDRDKVLKQGVSIADVYQTLQVFMGGGFVNYFNRFGRTWQVYVEAEGEFRRNTDCL